jgi:hypothetical protein
VCIIALQPPSSGASSSTTAPSAARCSWPTPWRAVALEGAQGLAASFNPRAGVLPLGTEAEEASDVGRGESSIDGVQGAALLVWAAQETGDFSLREKAVRHARRHIEFCLREDGSVCQSASFDPQTGDMLRRYTHKGVRDDSSWTRAQAWAMVGYAVMHLWTGERAFLDVATSTADWWLDVDVTHLDRSRGDDALRLSHVPQQLAWIEIRDDVEARVMCGDVHTTVAMPSAQRMACVCRPTQTAPPRP